MPGDLSAEDALRLQARPSEGSNLGFGEWLDEDAWVPEELPPTSDSGQWERLRAQYPGLAQSQRRTLDDKLEGATCRR